MQELFNDALFTDENWSGDFFPLHPFKVRNSFFSKIALLCKNSISCMLCSDRYFNNVTNFLTFEKEMKFLRKHFSLQVNQFTIITESTIQDLYKDVLYSPVN